jgi:hypothetical protein
MAFDADQDVEHYCECAVSFVTFFGIHPQITNIRDFRQPAVSNFSTLTIVRRPASYWFALRHDL